MNSFVRCIRSCKIYTFYSNLINILTFATIVSNIGILIDWYLIFLVILIALVSLAILFIPFIFSILTDYSGSATNIANINVIILAILMVRNWIFSSILIVFIIFLKENGKELSSMYIICICYLLGKVIPIAIYRKLKERLCCKKKPAEKLVIFFLPWGKMVFNFRCFHLEIP